MRASMRWLAVLAATLAGCSAETDPGRRDDQVGRTIQPVISGVPSGVEHDGVVVLAQFEAGTRRGFCSATLVAPNLVLTARHCVSKVDGTAGCNTDGTAAVGATIHEDVPATRFVVFAGKNGVVASTTDESLATARGTQLIVDDTAKTICNGDLAFLLLDRPVDAPIATLRLAGGPTTSERVTVVGWGITETGTLPATRRERADIALDGVGPMLLPHDARYGAGDAEIVIGESSCLGDSGGPAFTRAGVLVGVASRVGNGKPRDPANLSATCTGDSAHAVYTHLGRHAALVKRAFTAASNYPAVEPEPLAIAPPRSGDPHESQIGADIQDPSPAPEAKILRAKTNVDAATPQASDDGGCAVSRRSLHRGTDASWILVFAVGLALRAMREKRA